jgi:hypothetical protein
MSGPAIRARLAASGRPLEDPACAGCAHLGTLWALRRAGVEPRGSLGCDPGREPGARGPGRWAALAGAAALASRGPAALLAGARDAGARFLVVADRAGAPGARDAAAAIAAAGAPVRTFDPARLDDAAAAVGWAAAAGPGAALVALAPCARGSRRSGPLAVAPARCNRCGACLRLGCPALSDPGEDALAIDPSVCTGCGACAPLCRARAIG